MDTFCGKAAQKNFLFRPKIEHLFKIGDDNKLKAFKAQFEGDVKVFVDSTKRDQILAKIPKDLKIGGFNTHEFFQEGIDSILAGQTETHNNYNAKILSLVNLESIDDVDFVNAFTSWASVKVIDPKLATRVQENVPTMESDYKKLHDQFDQQVKLSKAFIELFDKKVAEAHKQFDNLINEKNPKAIEKILKDLEPALVRLFTQQAEIYLDLDNIIETLEAYNSQRVTWAKFLIGKVDSPKSNRPLKLKQPLAPKKIDPKRPPWKPAGKAIYKKK